MKFYNPYYSSYKVENRPEFNRFWVAQMVIDENEYSFSDTAHAEKSSCLHTSLQMFNLKGDA